MAKARKTISINALIDQTNAMLAESICGPEARNILCANTHALLKSVDAYCGVRYLKQHEVPAGHKPGINDSQDGSLESIEGTDDSRVAFIKASA